MTTVQKRFVAFATMIALAFSCAFLVSMPQQAEAATLTGATTLAYNKNLKASAEYTTYQDDETNFYSFVTSNRNSTYKITVRPESGVLEMKLFDSNMNEIASFYADGAQVTEAFPNEETGNIALDRGQTYYLSIKAPAKYTLYSVAVKEAVTPPAAVENLKAKSKKKKTVKVSYRKAFNASGYQVRYKKGTGKWKWANKKIKKTKASYTIKNLTRKKEYTIGVRPYRTVNGKNYYGEWAYATVTVK